MNLEDCGLSGKELLKLIPPHILAKQRADNERVKRLCEELGYGFVIHQASLGWKDKDASGAFAVGPCVAFTEPCSCKNRGGCDLCHGCGWNFKKSEPKQDGSTVCNHADECQQCKDFLLLLTNKE